MTQTETAVRGSDEELLIPDNDFSDPEMSIVIPALNERLTIRDFVAWCIEGLADAGIRGEILIVDSSTDDTSRLARRRAPASCASPSAGSGAHTWMPSRTSAAGGC